IGRIGFPVLLEIHGWLHFKKKNFRKKIRGLPFRFSLFSKIGLLAFIVLFIGETILIYLLEKHELFLIMNENDGSISSILYSIT
ncbi:TrkH family potassium uptake protein, partial [Enterococcus faecalis]